MTLVFTDFNFKETQQKAQREWLFVERTQNDGAY